MIRKAIVPIGPSKNLIPSDFAHDAMRLLDRLPDDWIEVECRPHIARDYTGRPTQYICPEWRFTTWGPAIGRFAHQKSNLVTWSFYMPFTHFTKLIKQDPHLLQLQGTHWAATTGQLTAYHSAEMKAWMDRPFGKQVIRRHRRELEEERNKAVETSKHFIE